MCYFAMDLFFNSGEVEFCTCWLGRSMVLDRIWILVEGEIKRSASLRYQSWSSFRMEK